MFFKCNAGVLANAVQIAERGVSQRTTLPVLGNILFEVTGKQLKISSNSLDLGIQIFIDVKDAKPGKVLAPAKMISSITSKLPDGDLTFETGSNDHIRLEVGSSKFLVHGLAATDFPELIHPKQAVSLDIPSETLLSMIKQTAFAVSSDESKPFLNGILFDLNGSEIRLVSTDGYRLALRSELFSSPVPLKAIVPTRTVNEVLKLLSSYPDEETVQVEVSADLIQFRIAQITVLSRVIQGQFPDYQMVIPSQSDTKVSLPRRVFLDAAERCAVVASSSNNILMIELSGDHLLLSANSPEVGDANEMVNVEVQGTNRTKIAFNVRLLLDVLKNIPEGDVQMELSRKLAPGVLRPKGFERNYLYIIMPIKTSEPVESDSVKDYDEKRREAVPV